MKKDKNLKIIYRLLGCLIFLALVIFGVIRLQYVTRDKENARMWDNFKALDKKSVSVFFVGNSHSFCSINPDLLYEEYGLDSFMLSSSGQTLAMDYYAIEEAIRYQCPETIYLEMSYAIHDWNTISDEMSHMFFDGMPLNKIKVAAVRELIDEDNRIYFYIPLGQFHSRWTYLTADDYADDRTSPRGRYYSEHTEGNWQIEVCSVTYKEEIPENAVYYMDLIAELCEKNDIKLILYTVPYNSLWPSEESQATLTNSQGIYNSLYDYATEKGLEYYNLFNEVDEIGLDYSSDFLDSQHFNCYGQDKFTRYMADKGYIKVQ